MSREFSSLKDFYPYYLSEHSNKVCKQLHFVGSTCVLVCVMALIMTSNLWYLLLGLVLGYGFAWVGHFFFEHNKPATFKYPVYSFISDWIMYKDIVIGKEKVF